MKTLAEITVREIGPCNLSSNKHFAPCEECGDACVSGALRTVVKTHTDGREQEMYMCIDCLDDYLT